MEMSEEYFNHPLLKLNKVLRREYQEKIFISSVEKNTLVVLPTSMGKTIIAILLAVYHLSKDENCKIIFLAPTKPLIVQHQKSFKELTVFDENEEKLPLLTGSIAPEKRKKLYSNGKVLFMTPQVLQNDIISNQVDLSMVKLIIFDEAHRSVGNYSYVFIADIYFKKNPNGHILALTASPGGDENKIQEVCRNLHINNIEIRTPNSKDVKSYIHELKIDWIKVELSQEYKTIYNILNKLFKEYIDKLIEEEVLENDKEIVKKKEILNCAKFIDKLINESNEENRPKYLLLKKFVSNAIRISHMLELLEAQGIGPLYEFLQKNYEEIKQTKSSKSLKELFLRDEIYIITEQIKKLIEKKQIHPKLNKLKEILHAEFKQNNNLRVLIFANYRDTINSIIEFLKDDPLIKVHKFIGQQNRKIGKNVLKGMSQKEQISILEDFKKGVFNVLIATSVAEEGLDIVECDLVIFYDVVPSEIRTIQRRGRTGRKTTGRVIILMTAGTREEGYYWASKKKEKNMQLILQNIQKNIKNFIYSSNESQQITSVDNYYNEIKNSESKINEINKKSGKDTEINKYNNVEVNLKEQKEKENNKSGNLLYYINKNLENNSSENTQDQTFSFENPEDFKKIENNQNSDEEKVINSNSTKSQDLTIIVDSRETQSAIVHLLSSRGVNVIIKQLPASDYIISDKIGIERKTSIDFNNSLRDGRLFDELHNLQSNFEIPILIIEGNPLLQSGLLKLKDAVLGAISSIILNMKINIIITSNPHETVDYLIAFIKKSNFKKSSYKKIFKNKPDSISLIQEQIIGGVPGINIFRAQDLLQYFSNIKNIFNASEEELLKVPGIGKKLAKKIKGIAEHNYNIEK